MSNQKRRYELLAPAGKVSSVRPLLENGANAIYVGLAGRSSRPSQSDLTMEEIRQAAEICREFGAKLHVAANAFVPEQASEALQQELLTLDETGADAVILADWGMLSFACRNLKRLEVHASTLLGAYNTDSLLTLKDMGVTRVVCSTNLYLDEICSMIDAVPQLEYEVVADGGICMNDNRLCELPHIVDGNRHYQVFCKQDFTVHDRDSGERWPATLKNQNIHFWHSAAPFLDAGVYSFKMEGRTVDLSSLLPRVRRMKAELELALQAPAGKTALHYVRHLRGNPVLPQEAEPPAEPASVPGGSRTYVALERYEDSLCAALDQFDDTAGFLLGDLACNRRMFDYGDAGMIHMAETLRRAGKEVIYQTPLYLTDRNFQAVTDLVRCFYEQMDVRQFVVQDVGMLRWITRHYPGAAVIWGRTGLGRFSQISYSLVQFLREQKVSAFESDSPARLAFMHSKGLPTVADYGSLRYQTLWRECYSASFAACDAADCRQVCRSRALELEHPNGSIPVDGYFLSRRLVYLPHQQLQALAECGAEQRFLYAETWQDALERRQELKGVRADGSAGF